MFSPPYPTGFCTIVTRLSPLVKWKTTKIHESDPAGRSLGLRTRRVTGAVPAIYRPVAGEGRWTASQSTAPVVELADTLQVECRASVLAIRVRLPAGAIFPGRHRKCYFHGEWSSTRREDLCSSSDTISE